MSALTQEVFDTLPETVQADYVKTDDGYQHGGFVKLKGSLNELDGKYKETESRLSEFEKAQEEKLNQARQEAYEKAVKEGNVEEIEKRYKEQLEDAQKRAGETESQYKNRLDAMANREKSAIATELSSMALDSLSGAFKKLVSERISIDTDTGKEIYLNADGSASSLDREGFINELRSDPLFRPMIKADVPTHGGGDVNGNTNGSAKGVNGGKLDGSKSERAKYFAQKFNYK